MAAKTAIEWTATYNEDGTITPGYTWNFIRGCRVLSAGCENCYAQGIAYRFSGEGLAYEGLAKKVNGKPRWTGKLAIVEKDLELPLTWKKPGKVFVNSMSDLFYEEVPFELVDKAIGIMHQTPHLDYQILTKRPARMLEYFKKRYVEKAGVLQVYDYGVIDWPMSNVWLGVSVENQKAADERIPLLLDTPATVRFLSCEPLLGPVDLTRWFTTPPVRVYGKPSAYGDSLVVQYAKPDIHWVIAGGESGPKARPMHPDWARSLRDQCQRSGVPFFFKQWGAYSPKSPVGPGEFYPKTSVLVSPYGSQPLYGMHVGSEFMHFYGKKLAGRLLDGKEHNEFPEVAKNEPLLTRG